MGMRQGYPNPSETGMRFDFSSPMNICRVTYKYMRIRYGDGEGKTCPQPTPLPYLGGNNTFKTLFTISMFKLARN